MGVGEVGRLRRAVFLDRDGVINRTIPRKGGYGPPWSVEQLELAPDAPAAVSSLARAGFVLVVVTNQPDIARLDLDRGTLNEINAAIRRALPELAGFLVCMHDDRDNCFCRKPKPGMLQAAALRYGLDLAESYMVGDRYKDVEAGQNAGCRTVWIREIAHAERAPQRPADCEVQTLGEAAGWILGRG
ncbi:MAG: HAD-IIIA family hydrolase [Bryobacterales bacterium]|nr:HAD-IIIA family hydrolase [Bryobacterales bacterium]